MNPLTSTIKKLFALSGNQCAFPSCENHIVNNSNSMVQGEICHIKAKSEKGPRYDSKQTDEERHSFENLILLCSTHHTIIDSDTRSYTVEQLLEMKREHENKDIKSSFDQTIIEDIANTLIRNNNIISIENSKVNFQGNQIANTIQNYTHQNSVSEELSYENILAKIFSSEEPFSKLLADTLKIAKKKNDCDIINLCKNELLGWTSEQNIDLSYRTMTIFISPLKIKKAIYSNTSEWWNDMEQKSEFLKIDTVFCDSVPDIEHNINNYSKKSEEGFFCIQRKQGSLVPNTNNPDVNVYIYGKGSLYFDLMNKIKKNFQKKIISKI